MSGLEIMLKSMGIDVEALMKEAQEKGGAAIAHLESIAVSLQSLDARMSRLEIHMMRLNNSAEFPSENLAGHFFNENPTLWERTMERLTNDGTGFKYFGEDEQVHGEENDTEDGDENGDVETRPH